MLVLVLHLKYLCIVGIFFAMERYKQMPSSKANYGSVWILKLLPIVELVETLQKFMLEMLRLFYSSPHKPLNHVCRILYMRF
jgi:hypothetical protein